MGVRSPDLTRRRVGDPTATKGLQSYDGFGAGELAAIERGNAGRIFPKRSRRSGGGRSPPYVTGNLRHICSDDIVLDVDYSVDLRPKTIWGGSTIPGKKMIKLIVPELQSWQRAQQLLELYKAPPSTVLVGVAQALHFTPEQGKAGPAFRDIGKGISLDRMYAAMYGAMLTDIRDFLKLRFRAKGMSEAEVADKARLSQALDKKDVGYIVNYLVIQVPDDLGG